MAARYGIRPDPDGWTVYDISTDLPAEVNGFIQVGLPADDADDLAELLNRLDNEQSAVVSHCRRRRIMDIRQLAADTSGARGLGAYVRS